MVVSTELHNGLIEREIENKLIESDRINQKAKTVLMIEKLKSILLIIAVIFLVLLILTFLYWIFPSKQNTINSTQIENLMKQYSRKCDCSDKSKPNIETEDVKIPMEKDNKQNSLSEDASLQLKNGTDYVKHNNYVYKRTWKDGVLIEDVQLEKTIKESREKAHEKIPQLATPNTGKIKNI